MKVKRVWIPAALLAVTLVAGTASAHPGHGRHHDDRPKYGSTHGYYWKAPARSKRMPDWLYYKPKFRRWYRRSEVRYNRHVAWRQVYRIYQRQMAARYYRHNGRGYGDDRWYRDDRRYGRRDHRPHDDRDDRPRRRKQS